MVFLSSLAAHALPPPENAEKQIASRKNILNASRDRGITGIFISMRTIRESFRVPISFEWSYVNDDRSEVDNREFKFAVQAGETLELTLDRFCVAAGRQLQWRRINGVICVWPTGVGGKVESTLDSNVSLKLEGVSTWEALLELARVVNATPSVNRTLMPSAEPRQDQYVPPLALREEKSISLALTNVTAREAVCAIMAASPLQMEFTYSNFYRPNSTKPRMPSSSLSFRAFDERGNMLYHVPESRSSREYFIWTDEANAVVPQHDSISTPKQDP
jgi:hypothetical protein